MDSYNSIFEILATFNFAFVASNAFIREVNIRLTGNLGKASEIYKKAKEVSEKQKEYLDKRLSTIVDAQGERYGILVRLTEEHHKIHSDLITRLDENSEKIETEGTSDKFKWYSLYSGLYCMLILLLSGIYSEREQWPQLLQEGILIFNILSPITILWLTKTNTWKLFNCPLKPGFTSTVYCFLGVALIPVFILLVFDGVVRVSTEYNISLYVTVTTLLLASAHFLITFGKAVLTSHDRGLSDYTLANESKNDVDAFAKTVSITLSSFDKHGGGASVSI